MLKGKLTYAGLAVVLVGLLLHYLGVPACDAVSAGDVCADHVAQQVVDAVSVLLQAVGLVMAARGKHRQAAVVYKDEE